MHTASQTLSVGQKAGWGLADMGVVVFVIVKQLLVLSFLTNYLSVPVGIAGLLTTSILIFDIITDPIVVISLTELIHDGVEEHHGWQ